MAVLNIGETTSDNETDHTVLLNHEEDPAHNFLPDKVF